MKHRKRWPKGTWMRLRSSDTLRALMKQSDLSLQDLANCAGCSKGFISHLLSGRRSSCTVALAGRIALVLHVPTEVLFEARMSPSGMSTDNQKKVPA